MNKKKYFFLDALRGLAMIAVVVDHTYQLTYSSEKILTLSSFSVTLFILLAGVTAFLSMDARGIKKYDWRYVRSRLKKIFVPYTIATAFCIFTNGWWHFDLVEFVKSVILFDAEPPFYFVFFFLQLILVSPFVYMGVKIIFTRKRLHHIINMAIILVVVGVAYLCTEYTTMLELHGGAYYLFGGSYLIVYFTGMAFGACLNRGVPEKLAYVMGCISVAALTLYVGGVLTGILTRQNYSLIYDKWNANPPGFRMWIYAVAIYGAVFGIYRLIEKKTPYIRKIFVPIEICGRYSLNIFLYHYYFIIILRNTLFVWVPYTLENIWIRRGCVLIVAVILPIAIKMLYNTMKLQFLTLIQKIMENDNSRKEN